MSRNDRVTELRSEMSVRKDDPNPSTMKLDTLRGIAQKEKTRQPRKRTHNEKSLEDNKWMSFQMFS